MYLKKLYYHNRILFWFIILFAAFQLVNNLRQDVSFSPVYTYGMYSQVMQPQNTYIIPEIIVNDKPLQTKDFSPQQWDKIVQPIILFSRQQQWNSYLFQNYIQRLVHISDSSYYVNRLSTSQFNDWYKKYLSSVLHTDVLSLSINFSAYNFIEGKLIKIHSLQNGAAL